MGYKSRIVTKHGVTEIMAGAPLRAALDYLIARDERVFGVASRPDHKDAV